MIKREIDNSKELLLELSKKRVCIYGAGNFANEISYLLQTNAIPIDIYLVSSLKDNPKEIEGIKVNEYNEYLKNQEKDLSNCALVIAINQAENKFGKLFDEDGWGEIIFSTPDLINDIMISKLEKLIDNNSSSLTIITKYPNLETGFVIVCDSRDIPFVRINMLNFNKKLLRSIRKCTKDEFQKIYGNLVYIKELKDVGFEKYDATIFVVTSENNKTSIDFRLPVGYEMIQGGRSISHKKMPCRGDDVGTNISNKNHIYSECTVHYWAWKNVKEKEYIGISHYRRQQLIGDTTIEWMKENDIDFIVALPQFVFQKIKDFYLNYIEIKYWNIMREAFLQMCEEYVLSFDKVIEGHFYFPCNIFFARKDAYDDYCEFLFEITGRIETIIEREKIKVEKRYMGYLTEIIESVYFAINKEKLKIAYSDVKYYPK